MKAYIVIGENGKVKKFKNQGETRAYFGLTYQKMTEAVSLGKPVEDPETLEPFCLDELLERYEEPEEIEEHDPEEKYWD